MSRSVCSSLKNLQKPKINEMSTISRTVSSRRMESAKQEVIDEIFKIAATNNVDRRNQVETLVNNFHNLNIESNKATKTPQSNNIVGHVIYPNSSTRVPIPPLEISCINFIYFSKQYIDSFPSTPSLNLSIINNHLLNGESTIDHVTKHHGNGTKQVFPVQYYPTAEVMHWEFGKYGKAWKDMLFRVGDDFVNYKGMPLQYIQIDQRPTQVACIVEQGQSGVKRSVLENFSNPLHAKQFLHWLRVTMNNNDANEISRFASIHKRSKERLSFECKRFRGTPVDNKRLRNLVERIGMTDERGQMYWLPKNPIPKIRDFFSKLDTTATNFEQASKIANDMAHIAERTRDNVATRASTASKTLDSLPESVIQATENTSIGFIITYLEDILEAVGIAYSCLFYVRPEKRRSFMLTSIAMAFAKKMCKRLLKFLCKGSSKMLGAFADMLTPKNEPDPPEDDGSADLQYSLIVSDSPAIQSETDDSESSCSETAYQDVVTVEDYDEYIKNHVQAPPAPLPSDYGYDPSLNEEPEQITQTVVDVHHDPVVDAEWEFDLTMDESHLFDDDGYDIDLETGQGILGNFSGGVATDIIKWIGSLFGMTTMERMELTRLKDNVMLLNTVPKLAESFIKAIWYLIEAFTGISASREEDRSRVQAVMEVVDQEVAKFDVENVDRLDFLVDLHNNASNLVKYVTYEDRKKMNMMQRLSSLKKLIMEVELESEKRPKPKINPVTLYLYGEPGVGKSTSMFSVARGIYKALGEEYKKEENLYQYRSSTSGFVDGFKPKSHKVCVIEDFGLTNDQAALYGDVNFFARAATDIPYQLTMASLAEKGTTWMNSEILMVNSNRPMQSMKSHGTLRDDSDRGIVTTMFSMEAFRRRFDFIVRMVSIKDRPKGDVFQWKAAWLTKEQLVGVMADLLVKRRDFYDNPVEIGAVNALKARRFMVNLNAFGDVIDPVVPGKSRKYDRRKLVAGLPHRPTSIDGDNENGQGLFLNSLKITTGLTLLLVIVKYFWRFCDKLFDRTMTALGFNRGDNIMTMKADEFVRHTFPGRMVDLCIKGPHSHYCSGCRKPYTVVGKCEGKCGTCDEGQSVSTATARTLKHERAQSVSTTTVKPVKAQYSKGEFGQAIGDISSAASFFAPSYGDPNVINVARVVAKNQFEFTTKDGNIGKGLCLGGRLCVVVNHTLPINGGSTEIKIDFYNVKNISFTLYKEKTYSPEDTDLLYFNLPVTTQQFPKIEKHILRNPCSNKDRGYVIGASISSKDVPILTMKAADGVVPEMTRKHYTVGSSVVYVSRTYTYKTNTIAGDCGSVVFAEDAKSPEKIVGMHVSYNASSGRGRCTQLLQGDVEEAKNKLNCVNDNDYVESDDDNDIAQGLAIETAMGEFVNNNGEFSYYEQVATSELSVTSGGNNSKHSTIIAGQIREVETAPSRMRAFYKDGIRIDPLLKDMTKGDVPAWNHNGDEAIFDAQNSFFEDFSKACVENKDLITDFTPRLLTDDEVLNGIKTKHGTTSEWYGKVNMNTAPGFPYTQQGLGKKDLIDDVDGHLEMTDRIKEEFEEAEKCIAENDRSFCVFTPALKDEIRPIEKVIEGKTRVFQVSNLVFCLLIRKYFGMLIAVCMALHSCFDVSVGINPFGQDWTELATSLHFGQKGYTILGGDHSGWDKMVTKQEGLWLADFAKRYYPKRFHKILDNLCEQIFSGYYVIGSNVYKLSGGMPSGIPLTSVGNSIINSILLRVLYFKSVSSELGWHFIRQGDVRFRVYGDDHLICIPSSIKQNFNMHVIRDLLAVQGKKYTSPLKTGDLPIALDIDTVTYLKRSFKWNGSKWLAPLELPVIIDILNWKLKGMDSQSALTASFQSFVIELSQHPKETYDYFVSIGMNLLREAGIFVYAESYERVQASVGNTAGLLMYSSAYVTSRNIIMTCLHENGDYIFHMYDYHFRDLIWCHKNNMKFKCKKCKRMCIVISEGYCAACNGLTYAPESLFHDRCEKCAYDSFDPGENKEGGPVSLDF